MRERLLIAAMTLIVALFVAAITSGLFAPRADQDGIGRCIKAHQGPPAAVAECWSAAR